MTDQTPRGPRIRPGGRAEIGAVNAATTRILGAATGGGPPNLFTTVARHRRLYRAWLRFAAALMPGGQLPRADSELVILRVAHNHDCTYEWRHHEHLAQRAGLTAADLDRMREQPQATGWTPRQTVLLTATDELHDQQVLGEATWARLEEHLTETERIELLMLVGHYAMLAMLLNSLQVDPDPPPTPSRSPLGRIAMKVADRRG